MSSEMARAEAGEVSELREFIDSDGCPELIRARVEALLKFLTERNIDATVDDYVSVDVGEQLPQLTLKLTLAFEWRKP